MPSSRPRDSWIRHLLPGEERTLDLIPMAGRRALDRAGRKLSLAGWTQMSEADRARLIDLGAQDRVEVEAVRALLPGVAVIAAREDVAVDALPPGLPAMRLERWRALSPVCRHALESYARRGRRERLAALLGALDDRSA